MSKDILFKAHVKERIITILFHFSGLTLSPAENLEKYVGLLNMYCERVRLWQKPLPGFTDESA